MVMTDGCQSAESSGRGFGSNRLTRADNPKFQYRDFMEKLETLIAGDHRHVETPVTQKVLLKFLKVKVKYSFLHENNKKDLPNHLYFL